MTFLSSLLVLVMSAHFADAKSVVFSSDPYPPFIYEKNGKVVGDVVNLLPEILGLDKVDIELRIMPWKRVLSEARAGRVDLLGPLFRTPDRDEYLLFTDTLFEGSITVWTSSKNKKLKNFVMRDYRQLAPYSMGHIAGYSYPPDFQKFMDDKGLKYIQVNDIQQALKMLQSERIDVFLAYAPVMKYYIEESIYQNADFKAVGIMAQNTPYILGISKKSPWAAKLPEINKRIHSLRKRISN